MKSGRAGGSVDTSRGDLGTCSIIKVHRERTNIEALNIGKQNFLNHTSTLVGHRIYVIGGIASHTLYREKIHLLDTVTWRWEEVPLEGVSIRGLDHLDFLINDQLYICGGISSPTPSKLWRFDAPMRTFERCKTLREDLVPDGNAAGEYIEALQELVVFGGIAHSKVSDQLVVLSLRSGGWRVPAAKGAPPPRRYNHSSCLHGTSDVYFFGGNENHALTPCDNIFLLQCSPGLYMWSQPVWVLQPTAQASAVMACAGNRIFVFGGYPSNGTRKSNELFVGEVNSHKGYRLIARRAFRAKLPGPQLVGTIPEIALHTAVATRDKLIVLGGEGCPDNVVFVFSPYK